MQTPLDISIIEQDAYLLYPVTGHFTAQHAIGLKEDILRALPPGGQMIVLDMTAVTDADIVSVNALVQIYLGAMRKGNALEIRLRRDEALDEMLHLCKFHRRLNLVYI